MNPQPFRFEASYLPPLYEHGFPEMTLDDVARVLSLTIKDDDANKKLVFLGMLSAYTDKSQINISLNAPSSTGKTYLATEISKLFPAEDKIERSGASPTSFFYGEGKKDVQRGAKIVSLRRKILIFFEMPNPALQEKLRALLSHDSREITHSLTNRDKKGANKTETIILEGFAATIFCSANMKLDEQEATRAILVSPESTEEKIREAIKLRIRRGSNEVEFDDWLASQAERNELMRRIVAIREEQVDEIIILDREGIDWRFFERLGALKPRHSRDVDHLLQLIKAIALLNVWYRRQPDGRIIANESDIDQAFDLFDGFFESQDLNLPPAVLAFYKKYIKPAYIRKHEVNIHNDEVLRELRRKDIGLTAQELNSYYFKVENASINADTLRKSILPQLESAGLIVWDKPAGDEDKRSRHIFPQVFTGEEENHLKYIGNGGMSEEEIHEMLRDF
jgi:hypothetical protein